MDPIMALVNTEGFWNSKLKSIIYILKSVFHVNRKTLQRIYSSFRSFRGTKTTQEGIILKLKFESHFWSPLKKLFKKFRDRFIERSNFPLGLKGHSRDPGFDQNTVCDSGILKMSWGDTGFERSVRKWDSPNHGERSEWNNIRGGRVRDSGSLGTVRLMKFKMRHFRRIGAGVRALEPTPPPVPPSFFPSRPCSQDNHMIVTCLGGFVPVSQWSRRSSAAFLWLSVPQLEVEVKKIVMQLIILNRKPNHSY